MQQTILITGAAGYVGAMLVREFATREDIGSIIGIDKEPLPEFLQGIQKLIYIQSNLADPWEEKVRGYKPEIVIHTAWQIRELYGKQALQWQWNIGGSDRVFDFAFAEPSVRRLIHFSTVASYGAFPANTIEHRFTEKEPFRSTDYLYAEEKRVAEEHLRAKFEAARGNHQVEVVIIRPAAITGPRGRFMRIRFGLQAALSGQLKESMVHRIISAMVSVVPVTKKWCRQFIHEDDVVAIISLLAFTPLKNSYDAFNISPPGEVVRGPDMARAVGKHMIRVHPLLIRFVFFCAWHLSRGRVPTSRGGWKSYSYPILVDGSTLTRLYGYQYRYPSYDAFYYTNGRYEEFVPPEERRHKNP